MSSIAELFAEVNEFTAVANVTIPGIVETVKIQTRYLYLDQEQVDAALNGEVIEIDGEEVDTNSGPFLEAVVKGWKPFVINGKTINFSEDELKSAMNHACFRKGLAQGFFDGIRGDGGVRRKN